MSVTYGFYNSIKGDRKYNALEMSSIFDGIIVDGVYMSIGDALNVKSSGGMGITVGIGRAWFNHTWTLNDSLLPLTLANSDVLLNRIDAIVLEVNNNTEVRKNTIKILKGTPASKPVKPSLIESELVNQHPLAYISVPKGATSISQSNITNAVGTSECPFVTGVLEGMDIDKLVAQWGAQWGAQWAEWLSSNTDAFNTWFNEMKNQLSEDAAGNLQASKMDKATYDADGDGVVDKAAAVPWDGVTGKPGTFTPSTHNHDDRYYTETEMNTKLNGKANSIHTHTKDQVGLSKVNNNSISMGLSGTDLWVYYS